MWNVQWKDPPWSLNPLAYVVPVLLLLVVIANLIARRAYLPAAHYRGNAGDGLLEMHTPGWGFAGIIMMKIALAAGLFSWFTLADRQRTEHPAQPGVWAAIVLIVAGLAMLLYGTIA